MTKNCLNIDFFSKIIILITYIIFNLIKFETVYRYIMVNNFIIVLYNLNTSKTMN